MARDVVEESSPTLCGHGHCQGLGDVHVADMGDTGTVTPGTDELYGQGATKPESKIDRETVSINSHFQLTKSHARCILEILGPFLQITVEVPNPALILGNDGWLHPINTLRHILQPGKGIPKSLKVLVNVGVIRTDYGSSPSCPALWWTASSSGPS